MFDLEICLLLYFPKSWNALFRWNIQLYKWNPLFPMESFVEMFIDLMIPLEVVFRFEWNSFNRVNVSLLPDIISSSWISQWPFLTESVLSVRVNGTSSTSLKQTKTIEDISYSNKHVNDFFINYLSQRKPLSKRAETAE